MYVLCLIVLLVFIFVTHAHGFLIGLVAAVGMIVGMIGLLLLLGRWATKRPPAAPYTSPGTVPEAGAKSTFEEVPPDWEAIAPRDSDRTLPRDHLPYPLGGGVTTDDHGVLPGYLGRECYLQPLRIDLGETPYCWSWRASTWLKGDAAREVFAVQLYERLQGALADEDAAPPLAGEDDLARHGFALEGKPRFLAFRSRDARWGGFLYGEASFRFPLERLAGLHLRIGHPARGSGGYELYVVLAEGEERVRSLETHLTYELRTTSSLLAATMQLGKLFDVPVGCEEYADEMRGTDESRPYDR